MAWSGEDQVSPPGRPKAKRGPLGGQGATRSVVTVGACLAAGPSQGETRPPRGQGATRSVVTVGAISVGGHILSR